MATSNEGTDLEDKELNKQECSIYDDANDDDDEVNEDEDDESVEEGDDDDDDDDDDEEGGEQDDIKAFPVQKEAPSLSSLASKHTSVSSSTSSTAVGISSSSISLAKSASDPSKVAAIEPKVKEMISYMLKYSFSKNLNNNTAWTQLIFHAFGYIIDFIGNKSREKITMRNILKAISPLVGQHLITINRKREEILSIEATIVLAFMKSEYCSALHMDINEFNERYPSFCPPDVDEEEKAKLYEFCNCVRVVQQLIPAKNNKEHILDLVSRLTEGFAVRRVTGTGMTIETRNRYDIIHREGGLTPRQRIDRQARKAALDALNGIDPSSRKRRGRPLSSRAEEPQKKKFDLDSNNLLLLLQAGTGNSRNNETNSAIAALAMVSGQSGPSSVAEHVIGPKSSSSNNNVSNTGLLNASSMNSMSSSNMPMNINPMMSNVMNSSSSSMNGSNAMGNSQHSSNQLLNQLNAQQISALLASFNKDNSLSNNQNLMNSHPFLTGSLNPMSNNQNLMNNSLVSPPNANSIGQGQSLLNNQLLSSQMNSQQHLNAITSSMNNSYSMNHLNSSSLPNNFNPLTSSISMNKSPRGNNVGPPINHSFPNIPNSMHLPPSINNPYPQLNKSPFQNQNN